MDRPGCSAPAPRYEGAAVNGWRLAAR